MASVLIGIVDPTSGDILPFDYGSNPLITLVFAQNGTATAPNAVVVKLTDPNGVASQPTATATGSPGTYTVQVTGGVTVAGRWTGRAYAPPGTGEASVDFQFYVNGTANP